MAKFWTVLYVTILWLGKIAGLEYFTDQPPLDYYNRSSLEDCPRRFYSKYKRIPILTPVFGGEEAARGEFQHMAAIGWTTRKRIEYLCGGTLITSKFVMTAAHCAVNKNGKTPDTVRLGDTNLEGSEDAEFSKQIEIKRFIRHPQHRFSRRYFDIALIELVKAAQFNEAICNACLWLEKYAPVEPLSAVGFGAVGYGTGMSSRLQKGALKAISKEECIKRLPLTGRSLPEGLHQTQFCAASDNQDTCEGDSGGPLQIERVDIDGDVIPLIVGIVSFGTPCMKGSTGVYTRVASYRDWIEQELGQSMDYIACTRTSKCLYRKQQHTRISTPLNRPVHRVGLLWEANEQDLFKCGATLIDYRFALTSAFCTRTKRGFPMFIGVQAENDTHVSRDVIPIDDVYVHPQYEKVENDIALLKLSKYLKADGLVLPACLWRESNFRKENHERYVIYTVSNENNRCAGRNYPDMNLLCGDNSINLVPNVCTLDYGGPVTEIYTYFDKSPYLYGVVSTLSRGCGHNLIGISITQHVEWITGIVLDHTYDRLIFSS